MDGKASIDGSDRYRRSMVESNDAWFSFVDEGLAKETVKRGIVGSISSRQVDRFFGIG
jgi:hypothetical protein